VLYCRNLRRVILRKTIKTANMQTQIENASEGFYCKILIVLTVVITYFVLVSTNVNRIVESFYSFLSAFA
jgi:hypothetical protein